MNERLAGIWAIAAVAVVSIGATGTDGLDVKGTARAGTRAVPNAVVWLEAPNAPPSPQAQRVVLHQRSLTFTPHVLAVRVGTTVDFPNEDRVFHNVFSFHDGKVFDLGTYPVGSLKRVVFSEPGVSRVFCNIHPHMASYVVAVDSPYFSAVDQDGGFTIKGVSPGSYVYRAWRPGGPILSGSVVVQAASVLEIVWPREG